MILAQREADLYSARVWPGPAAAVAGATLAMGCVPASAETTLSRGPEHVDFLVTETKGARFSRRDKGPLRLTDSISDHRELRDPLCNERSMWHVVEIESI